jgi:hypothetical protein
MRFASTGLSIVRNIQVILILTSIFGPVLGGQESHGQDQTAPPPLKIISRPERSQLTESKDSKTRVRTSIELAETHLANAEAQTSQREFDGAAAEAGKYWALLEDVLGFLKTMKSDSNKTRDLYKRLELTLRAQGPRLTAIRRSTPSEYAVWIKEIEEFARKGRTEALNSFYGQTVFREPQQSSSDQKQSSKPKGSPTPE